MCVCLSVGVVVVVLWIYLSRPGCLPTSFRKLLKVWSVDFYEIESFKGLADSS